MATDAHKAALGQIDEDISRWVILTDKGDQTACAWWGMSAEQVIVHLRSVADEIEEQRGIGRTRQ